MTPLFRRVALALLLALSACSKKPALVVPFDAGPAPVEAVVEPEKKKAEAPPATAPVEKQVPDAAVPHFELIREEPPDAGAGAIDEEATWRRRFREARERIDGFDKRLEQAQETVHAAEYARMIEAGGGPKVVKAPTVEETERAQQLLDHSDDERAAARSALEDLERQAAAASVPFEWRR